MNGYQGFAISNARTGFNESLEPWLLPRDGWQSLINCHLYRGVVEKILGYTLYADVMQRQIVSIGTPDGATRTFTFTLLPGNPIPASSNLTIYASLVVGTSSQLINTYSSYNSVTNTATFIGTGGSATIDLTTGVVVATFNTAPPTGTYSVIYIDYDSLPSPTTCIMGIKPYYTAAGSQDILVFDQLRVGKVVNNLGPFNMADGALQAVSQLPADYYTAKAIVGTTATGPYTGTLAGAPIEPGTVLFTEYIAGAPTSRTITDDGFGGLTGTGVVHATSFINYLTGAFVVNFTAGLPVINTVGVYGDLFSGGISNFFSLVNYQYKAFFTNGVDPVFYWDGTTVKYLNTDLTVHAITASGGIPAYDITRVLHVTINQQRLLLINVTVLGSMQVSTIFWSTVLNPLNFTNNERLAADTSQPIRAQNFINTDLIIRFANSEAVFRYTGDPTSPFRFDKTNSLWACDAPYSPINYDKWFSSVGRPAIVASDGVNVQRADEQIPDFTDPSRIVNQTPVPFMNQTSVGQCYGERFDDLKEGWLCYNSQPGAEGAPTISDNVLAFNYLDSTYAVYSFPFTCLGLGRIINVPTWGTITDRWDAMAQTWDSYELTSNALIDLAGDAFDKVYRLNDGTTLGDQTTPVLMSAITKNFNPFIEDGQLARFGYIDIFVSANILSILRVQFYINDQLYIDANQQPAGYYQETILNFTPTDAMSPTTNQVKVWKRIYVGSVAKEHTIRFYQNAADFTIDTLGQPIYIHAIVPYFKPAGRIFN